MPSPKSIGARLRATRRARSMTLKDIEEAAGISATHVSDIERGKSSPTLGSLARIATALGKDVSYFLEEEALDEVCHLEADAESFEPLPWGGGHKRRLTRLIPGARLSAYEVRLDPGGPQSQDHDHEGNEVYLVREGKVEFTVNGQGYVLHPGDSIHIQSKKRHRYRNAGPGDAKMLFFTTRRHTL